MSNTDWSVVIGTLGQRLNQLHDKCSAFNKGNKNNTYVVNFVVALMSG